MDGHWIDAFFDGAAQCRQTDRGTVRNLLALSRLLTHVRGEASGSRECCAHGACGAKIVIVIVTTLLNWNYGLKHVEIR